MLSKQSAVGDFVYSDVEFRHYRRHRAERLLRTGVGFLLAYVIAWSAVALARGDWLALTVQGISACGAAWVWFCLSRNQLGLASHSYFWIVIPVVASLIAVEHHGLDLPFFRDLVTGLDDDYMEGGYVTVPDTPGLGIELNEEAIEAHLRPGTALFGNTDEWNRLRVGFDRVPHD